MNATDTEPFALSEMSPQISVAHISGIRSGGRGLANNRAGNTITEPFKRMQQTRYLIRLHFQLLYLCYSVALLAGLWLHSNANEFCHFANNCTFIAVVVGVEGSNWCPRSNNECVPLLIAFCAFPSTSCARAVTKGIYSSAPCPQWTDCDDRNAWMLL